MQPHAPVVRLIIFEFENILMSEEPRTNILKGLFRHIYIEMGQIKCFNFSFLRWGMRVTYNSDIFEKSRPPSGFFCIFLTGGHLRRIHYEIFPKFFRIKIVTPPLKGILSPQLVLTYIM